MRGLEEIKQINANPKAYFASRDADLRYPRGPVKPAAEVAAEHGKRVEARRAANRAEVR
jgi:hypothetical protein